MKKLFFFYILFLVSIVAKSQDIIIKKNGDEIKAKVSEIGVNEIKYKRFDFQDGPTYSISKTEVVLVRYENGMNEIINSGSSNNSNNNNYNNNSTNSYQPVTSPPIAVEPEKVSKEIQYVYGSYSQGGRYVSKTRVIKILSETKDGEINRLLKKSKHRKNAGNIIALSVGLPLIIVGTITTLSGITANLNATNNGYNPDGTGMITVGAIMAGSGVLIQFANIGFQSRSRKAISDAIAIYNKKYADRF